MKIDRLIGILSILLQKDKVTSTELAERFEVSRRTILRDVESLNMAGIPIVSEQGQGGGISILSGYKVDRTLLSSDEMRAILSGLQSLDSVSGTNRYRRLMEKLSIEGATTVNASNHIIIDLASWDKAAIAEKIELITRAMEERRDIEFTYFSPRGETRRAIEPYHLIFQWSSWYVWGYCTARRDYRMFKLTRMTDLKLTDTPFAEREVPEYVTDKGFHSEQEVTVTVQFDVSQKWRVIDEFGADRLQYADNGDLLVTFTYEDAPSLYRYILSFGDEAEIVGPEDLRRGFAKVAKKLAAKYET